MRLSPVLCVLATLLIGGFACGQNTVWEVEVGTLFLKKEAPGGTTLFVSPIGGTPQLNDSVFEFDHAFGPEVTLIRHLDDDSQLECKFFGIEGWSDTASFTSATGANLNTNPPAGGPTIIGARVLTQYNSELFSTECNYRQQVSDFASWLIGFRMAELHEDFDAQRNNIGATGNADIHIDADNYLFGGQIGGDILLFSYDNFQLEGFVKAGLFANNANNSLIYSQSPGGSWVNRDGKTETSFLGELGLTGVIQLGPFVSIKAGYQVLWVTNVAEATTQVPRFNIVPLPGVGNGIDSSGSPVYHGGNVVLVIQP